MLSRRQFLKRALLLSAGLALPTGTAIAGQTLTTPQPPGKSGVGPLYATPGLDPLTIPQFMDELVRPPAMPKSGEILDVDGTQVDYYEIGVRQFSQQILPATFPKTTVWSYGPAGNLENDFSNFNFPAFTIEALHDKPVRVRWVNQLTKTVDLVGGGTKKTFLPHLLPVDPTLHWANPVGPIDSRPVFESTPGAYLGPVPIVTHVHGAHVSEEGDGYAEAWFLPDAEDLPETFIQHGGWYERFKEKFEAKHGSGPNAAWTADSSVYQYPNDQRAGTLWYHDHTLGMTRLNVYAGPAGFYLLRGGPEGSPVTGTLPAGSYEFPVAIQDRSFNLDLAAEEAPLFYPDSRKFFDGFSGPYIPGSDISPIWNPEIFGNTLVTNGRTWPKCTVERKRYRIRLLNGCNARTLILKLTTDRDAVRPVAADANVLFWVIGTEGGFLPDSAIQEDGLLMMPAERFEIILDFSKAPGDVNTYYLINEGPDEPFGGGVPDKDFPSANSATTGVVMRFDLVDAVGADTSADPAVPGALVLPPVSSLPAPAVTRLLSLNEADSHILHDVGPSEATLGMVMFDPNNEMPMGMGMEWMHAVTERVTLGDTEVWELYNFTMDAHPIHVHEVLFQVINREVFDPMMPGHGIPRPPEAWEVGFKDTVISYPGEITRIKARFDLPGRYVWHCHIVEHEDNEMMRPYDVVYRNYMPTIGA